MNGNPGDDGHGHDTAAPAVEVQVEVLEESALVEALVVVAADLDTADPSPDTDSAAPVEAEVVVGMLADLHRQKAVIRDVRNGIATATRTNKIKAFIHTNPNTMIDGLESRLKDWAALLALTKTTRC